MAKRKSTDTPVGRSLVIVESPAKAKTINKYLGKNYVVKASMGHVRDLPKHDMGIDLENGFEPKYEVVRARAKVIKELQKLANSAPQVYLASDRDREGEAIAWHLVQALNLPAEKTKRVIFNEITRSAISEAFDHPHEIDLDRVNAQQARRILDRIVGYELSPLLWRKIAKGLSAGRVQSVAVRVIVEREREIREFHPEESWKIAAFVSADPNAADKLAPEWAEFIESERTQKEIQKWLSERAAFRTELVEVGGAAFEPANVEDARAVVEALGYDVERVESELWEEYKHLDLKQTAIIGGLNRARVPQLTISDLTTKRTKSRPPAPFTTASLQQQASTVLRFATSRTMRTAQGLYEGVALDGEGSVGLITYMRTDSTHLSKDALSAARAYIKSAFGDRYLPEKPNFFGKRQARTQEAHEAIRPTDPHRTPESIRAALSAEQFKLYDLIWKRFVACQMPSAEWDSTSVSVSCETSRGKARFAASGRKLVFDGFMKVAGISSADQIFPPFEIGAQVGLIDLEPKQCYTSPPPRYNEASLVKTLESEGIGRPSTYAAIIDTIQQRGYVEQEQRKFFATALGEIVTDKLVEHFPKIMEVGFTSFMEDELDKIEESHLDWVRVLHEFYDPFKELLDAAGESMQAARAEPSEHICPHCKSAMLFRWSKTGRFLACSGYPDCKHTINLNRKGEPLHAETHEVKCDTCGKPMSVKNSRNGMFLGCSGYPECRNTMPCDDNGVPLKRLTADELKHPCEACGQGTMVVKWRRLQAYVACDRYPKCKNRESLPAGTFVKKPPAAPPEEAGVACEKCGRPMVLRSGTRGKFIACSGFPRCKNTAPVEKLEELRVKSPAKQTLAEANGNGRKAGVPKGKNGKVDLTQLGDPPPGFAWTRTGRPVVETMPKGDLICPDCGEVMDLRRGRFGLFYSCTGFPKCRFVSNLRGQAKKDAEEQMPAPARPKPIPTDIPCDDCGQPMMVREGRSGKFLGCSGYPKCKSTSELPPGFVMPEPVDAVAAK